jgi:hypothetical protein
MVPKVRMCRNIHFVLPNLGNTIYERFAYRLSVSLITIFRVNSQVDLIYLQIIWGCLFSNTKLYEYSVDIWMMNLNVCWSKRVLSNFRYYPCISLEGLRKPVKYLSQFRLSWNQDLNPGIPRMWSTSASHSAMTFGSQDIRSKACDYGGWCLTYFTVDKAGLVLDYYNQVIQVRSLLQQTGGDGSDCVC